MQLEDKIRISVTVITALVALSVGTVFGYIVFRAASPTIVGQIVSTHFVAVMMGPLIAMTSLLVVLIFRASSGPIEFEALGFKFSGASGQTVMWILCVFALTIATNLLWIAAR